MKIVPRLPVWADLHHRSSTLSFDSPDADSLYLDLYLHLIYHGIDSLEVPMARTAKLFRNGRSQAVRLPSEYRFEGSEVYVRRDPGTGDVILSRRPESWEDFFELMKSIDVPSDFLADRDDLPQKRKLF
jgi:antitoxin VapB